MKITIVINLTQRGNVVVIPFYGMYMLNILLLHTLYRVQMIIWGTRSIYTPLRDL